MPIYEYECRKCRKQFQALIMNPREGADLVCPQCNSPDLKKLISETLYHLSEQDRLNAFDPSVARSDSFYKDSRQIGLQAKKRARQMGVELGDGFEKKLEKVRTDPSRVFKEDLS
jgi:putative FmdB family regulatory protein